jgi:DNA uptake protein ComE-like DNA-binding protein
MKNFVYAVFSIIKKHNELEPGKDVLFKKVHFKESKVDIVTAMILQIPSVGPVKAKDISNKYNNSLKTFITKVTVADLQEINGIGKILSKKIIETIK